MPVTWARNELGRARGFTLLELLVVIAIMAALAAAFPLALNRFVPARRVDGAARELLADIRVAQARSVASDAAVEIVPAEHGYEVRVGTGRESRVVVARKLRSSTVLALYSLADEAHPLAAFRAFPDGSSSGGRFVVRDGERVRSVSVSQLTSRTHVEAGS
jgi:general secretion pathway protein H